VTPTPRTTRPLTPDAGDSGNDPTTSTNSHNANDPTTQATPAPCAEDSARAAAAIITQRPNCPTETPRTSGGRHRHKPKRPCRSRPPQLPRADTGTRCQAHTAAPAPVAGDRPNPNDKAVQRTSPSTQRTTARQKRREPRAAPKRRLRHAARETARRSFTVTVFRPLVGGPEISCRPKTAPRPDSAPAQVPATSTSGHSSTSELPAPTWASHQRLPSAQESEAPPSHPADISKRECTPTIVSAGPRGAFVGPPAPHPPGRDTLSAPPHRPTSAGSRDRVSRPSRTDSWAGRIASTFERRIPGRQTCPHVEVRIAGQIQASSYALPRIFSTIAQPTPASSIKTRQLLLQNLTTNTAPPRRH